MKIAVQIAPVPWERVFNGHLERQIAEKAAKSLKVKNSAYYLCVIKNISF